MLTIPQVFDNKNVLVTGATGFLGKTLLEKLFRTCPDIGNVYLLVRKKRGKSLVERVEDIISCPLYDQLKKENPNVLRKIKPIEGDLTKPRLGITKEDEDMLTESLNFIYHSGATVRFDESLHDALIVNVRSTRDIVNLAMKCKKLDVLFHVSTCYCNVENHVIEEKFYPPPMDWRTGIRLTEKQNADLDSLCLKCIQGWPNTYTFSKRLAEAVIVDLCSGKLPVVVLRPSIVVYNLGDPQPGWNDNMNGPFSLITAVLKGVVSILYGDSETALNMVFVDNVVKAMIIATKEKMCCDSPLEPTFYNASTDLSWTLGLLKDGFAVVTEKMPHSGRIWSNENFRYTKCWYYYYMRLVVTHLTFALLIDSILKLCGKKTMLMKITRRIHITMQALEYFMHNKFAIKNDKYLQLQDSLSDVDRNSFQYKKVKDSRKGIEDTMILATKGIKQFILKEPIPPREETYKNTFRMYLLRVISTYLMFGFWLYLIFWKFDLATISYQKIHFSFSKII